MSSGSTTASSSSASSSASTSPASSHDPRFIAVGVVLGIFGLILLVVILVFTLRVRKRQIKAGEKSAGPYHGAMVLDKSHPATKIRPFGTPVTEGHSFRHIPGQDMRIAIRRPDGAWDFADPSEPFTPYGVSDVCPSPTSATSLITSGSTRRNWIPSNSWGIGSRSAISEYKEQESRASKLIRLGYDSRDRVTSDVEMGDLPITHPPPAYGHEPAVGPYVTYRQSIQPHWGPSGSSSS